MAEAKTPFITALLSGSVAGLSTDLALFPLDTVKTRLQSAQGLWAAGGLRGIYSGLGSAAVGSMPSAALFFCTYEGVKSRLSPHLREKYQVLAPMVAASCGEVMGCLVRVPCEVVKQRAQAGASLSSRAVLTATLAQEGFAGLYRGYLTTVLREIPFSLLQFPIWEGLKTYWGSRQGHPVHAWQSAICGAIAGGASSFVTTPLDVAKTRIMLAQTGTKLASGSLVFALKHVFSERGMQGLFAGAVPRVLWISVGGAIFLGAYDKSQSVISKILTGS